MLISRPMKVRTLGLIRLRASPRTIALIILLAPAPMAPVIIVGLRAPANTRRSVKGYYCKCEYALSSCATLEQRSVFTVMNGRELDHFKPALAVRSDYLDFLPFA